MLWKRYSWPSESARRRRRPRGRVGHARGGERGARGLGRDDRLAARGHREAERLERLDLGGRHARRRGHGRLAHGLGRPQPLRVRANAPDRAVPARHPRGTLRSPRPPQKRLREIRRVASPLGRQQAPGLRKDSPTDPPTPRLGEFRGCRGMQEAQIGRAIYRSLVRQLRSVRQRPGAHAAAALQSRRRVRAGPLPSPHRARRRARVPAERLARAAAVAAEAAGIAADAQGVLGADAAVAVLRTAARRARRRGGPSRPPPATTRSAGRSRRCASSPSSCALESASVADTAGVRVVVSAAHVGAGRGRRRRALLRARVRVSSVSHAHAVQLRARHWVIDDARGGASAARLARRRRRDARAAAGRAGVRVYERDGARHRARHDRAASRSCPSRPSARRARERRRRRPGARLVRGGADDVGEPFDAIVAPFSLAARKHAVHPARRTAGPRGSCNAGCYDTRPHGEDRGSPGERRSAAPQIQTQRAARCDPRP